MATILDHKDYHKAVQGLSAQLKLSEDDRDKYIEECTKAKTHIAKLVLENQAITCQLLEFRDTQERLLRAVDELKAVKEVLFHMKTELPAVEESKAAAPRQTELMELAFAAEKEKGKELMMHMSELNESNLSSNLSAMEEEKQWAAFISELDAELQITTSAVIESHQQFEEMKQQLNTFKNFKREHLDKTRLIDFLKQELNKVKESHNSDMELKERENSENISYIGSIEADVNQKEEELQSAGEKINDLRRQIETIMSEIKNLKDEMSKYKDRELGLQIEVAALRSELHEGRSMIAAAEVTKIGAVSSQSGLYLAGQQLAVEEQQAAKNEVQRLKLIVKNSEAEQKEDNESIDKDVGTDIITGSTGFLSSIAISTEDKSMIWKSEEVGIISETLPNDECRTLGSRSRSEVDILKEELQAANAEISDLRFHVEEAVKRAEKAEKAKEEIEDQLRKWRQKQQQIRAASEARRRQPAEGYGYVPLSKVLNMKF